MTTHDIAQPRSSASPLRVAILMGLATGVMVSIYLGSSGWARLGNVFVDPDDAMRLTQTRDWLAGQSWFDVAQYRMQAPEGVSMHWSRVDDLPIGFMITALRRLLGDGGSEKVAMLIWPTILIPILYAVAAATYATRGVSRLGTCLIALLSAVLLGRFSPGRVDHHALMTTLCAVATMSLLWRPSSRSGWVAGLATVLCLAVGFEDIAVLAVVGAAIAMSWAMDGKTERPVGYGLGCGVGGLLFGATFVPARAWASTSCDCFSFGWVAAVVCAGFGLAATALWTRGGMARRWAMLFPVAAATSLIFVVTGFSCVSDLARLDFHLDPAVKAYWLDHVTEVMSLKAYANGHITILIQSAMIPCLALASLMIESLEVGLPDPSRLGYALALALATMVGFSFIRNGGLPIALAAPVLAQGVASYEQRHGASAKKAIEIALAMIALPAFLAVLDFSGVLQRSDARENEQALLCTTKSSWTTVAAQPTGRVAGPIDLGAMVLSFTTHSVLAGGYHRAASGLLDTVTLMTGSFEQAGEVLRRRRIDYVIWCDGLKELKVTAKDHPAGLAARLYAGAPPSWLVPIEGPGPVRVARVDFENLP